MLHKLRISDAIAAGGAVLLFIATFETWFKLSAPQVNLNVWDLHVARWFIYLAILSAAWMTVATLVSRTTEHAVVLATPTIIFSLLSTISLFVRVVDAPASGAASTIWLLVALIGSIVILVGSFWSLRDEYIPAGFDKAPVPEVVHLDSAP